MTNATEAAQIFTVACPEISDEVPWVLGPSIVRLWPQVDAKRYPIAKANIQIKNSRICYRYACTRPAHVFLWR